MRGALVLVGGLPPPVLQHPVRGASGRRYRVDLCRPDHGTVVEVDGRVEYGDPLTGSATRAFWAEKRREDDIREGGWDVVRAVAADVVPHAGALVARVEAAFARAARRSTGSMV